MQDECDINEIMRRYQHTGVLPQSNRYPANYGDFSNATDYQASLNQVLEAKAAFEALPSHVRARFQNEPQQLLEFMEDPNNEPEAVKLGLVPAKNMPTPPQETLLGGRSRLQTG